ncbi:MAG: peptidase MA family metallohydrolase, partial [Dehalococcoidia bacterium]
VEAESGAEISEVRFRYTFLPENRSSTATAEFQPGTHVRASYTLRSGASLYIPPGKSIRYSWEIRDAAGNELSVPARDTSFADPRFTWQAATDGNVTVNYYQGGQRDAEVMALIARETIDKASALMGITFDIPIKIWAYANRNDFQIALAHESVTSNPGILGQAHEPDTFIMVVDRLSSPSALDTARHELTHLVTARAISKGPYQGLYPSWLNEGTSVYMQVSPNDVGYLDALDKAIREDNVIPLKSLTAGTRNRNVGLFYGEGYSVVKYLVDTHGAEKFAQMIAAFNRTGILDEAFREAFGADQTGVYQRWRESVGLSAAPAQPDQPVDTPAQATEPSSSDDNTVILAVVGSVLMVLLLGVAVAAGLLLARRARSV